MNYFGIILFLLPLLHFTRIVLSEVEFSLDKLYASYLLTPDNELPIESRAQLKRFIIVEQLDKAIQLSLKTAKMGKEIGSADEKGNFNDVADELKRKYSEVKLKIGKERIPTERQICHLWTFYAHLMKNANEIKVLRSMSIVGPFVEAKDCDRIDQIRAEGTVQERKWLEEYEKQMAIWHKLFVQKLLKNANKSIARLFERTKLEGENEFAFQLRKMIIEGNGEDKKLKGVTQRMLELVNGRADLFGELLKEYFAFTSANDVSEYMLSIYTKMFRAEAQLFRRKSIMQLNLLIGINWINELIRQKGPNENDWREFRREFVQFFDSIEPSAEADMPFLEHEFFAQLVLIYRLNKALEERAELVDGGKEWNVEELLQNRGNDIDEAMIDKMRMELGKKHAELLETFVETKKAFRKTLQALSGVELVGRMAFLLGKSESPKIGQLIQKYRQMEGGVPPEWYLATHHRRIDHCPPKSDKEGNITETYLDTEGAHLVEQYKTVLMNGELYKPLLKNGISPTDGIQFPLRYPTAKPIREESLKLNQIAAIWLFNNLIDELLLSADSIFVGDEGSVLLNNLWFSWAQVLEGVKEEEDQTKKLCRIYRFAMFTVVTLCEALEHRAQFKTLLNEQRWTEITLIGAQLPIIYSCDEEGTDALMDELHNTPNFELIHSLTLYRLLKRFKHFGHFLCNNSLDFMAIKDHLLVLINSIPEFDWLEKMFPVILQIDRINFRMRIYLYQQWFHNRNITVSESATNPVARIVVPLLLQELNVALFKGIESGIVTSMKFHKIGSAVHNNLYNDASMMESVTGICWLMYVIQSVTDEGTKSTKMLPDKQQMAECVKAHAKLKLFKRQWDIVQENHADFLRGSKGHAAPLFFAFSPEVPGARTRLHKMLGTKLFLPLWKQCKGTLRYPEVFTDDAILSDHYFIALLFATNELDRMVNKLAADLIVFVRWFDAEQKGLKLAKLWIEKRDEEMEGEYDQLFDANLSDEMPRISLAFEELFNGLRNFLMANRNIVAEKKLREGWDKVVRKAEKQSEQRMSEGKGGIGNKMPNWVLELHAKMMQKLVRTGQKDVFEFGFTRKELKTGLESSVEVRRRLLYFLEIEKIEELFRELEVPFEEEEFREEKGENGQEIMQESENMKNNKLKKKRKKKGKKEEVKEAEEDEETEVKTLEGEEQQKKLKDEDEDEEEEVKTVKGEEQRKKMKDEGEEVGEGVIGRTEMETQRSEEYSGDGTEEQQNGEVPLKKGKKKRNKWRKRDQSLINPDQLGNADEDSSETLTKKTDQNAETNIEMALHRVRDSKEDAVLIKLYLKFISDPNDLNNILLLDLAAYANEIWHRIKAIEQINGQYSAELGFQLWNNLNENLLEKWQHIEETEIPKEQNEQILLRNKFGEILAEELMGFGGIKGNGQKYEQNRSYEGEGDEQVDNSLELNKRQLHRTKFAWAIISNDQLRTVWDELAKEEQIRAIAILFGMEKENRKAKESARKEFKNYLEQRQKLREQIQLDENLHNNFVENGYLQPTQRAIWRNSVEHLQQIGHTVESDEEITLDALLREHGQHGLNESEKSEINAQIEKLRGIVKKWSKGKAALLVGGSFMLGVYTSGSDIDTLCIAPEHFHIDNFFGTHKCPPMQRHQCDDNSLLCLLCERLDVKFVQQIPTAWVPLIKLTLNSGLEFDIVFASIPEMNTIQLDDVDIGSELKALIRQLADRIKEEKKSNEDKPKTDQRNGDKLQRMLRSLAGFHSNLKLLEMMDSNLQTFRKLVISLKLWAKNSYIYNNVLGFLGGTSLCILAAKIVLMYPNSTVPFLIERFFFTYSTWEWPLPVQLANVDHDELGWRPEDELRKREAQFGAGSYAQMTMPIIAPGYPEQNSSFNINWFTAKIIQKAMRDGLKQLNDPHKSQKEKWATLFRHRPFTDLYSHFFVIVCVASDRELNDEFCGFVGVRIRAQLLSSAQCAQSGVQFCHARPIRDCLGEIVHQYEIRSTNAVCKAWVVGINMKNNSGLGYGHEIEPHLEEQFIKHQISDTVQIDFGDQIVESYKRVVLGRGKPLNLEAKKIKKFFNEISKRQWTNKGQSGMKPGSMEGRDFVHLESKYVERAELKKRWGI